jgi:Tetratricopeptide repeat
MLEKSLNAAALLYGDEHHSTLLAKNSLAGAYADTGDLDRSIPLYEQAYDVALRVLGEDHPHTVIIRRDFAHTAGLRESRL